VSFQDLSTAKIADFQPNLCRRLFLVGIRQEIYHVIGLNSRGFKVNKDVIGLDVSVSDSELMKASETLEELVR
jgi:hypothetical protein